METRNVKKTGILRDFNGKGRKCYVNKIIHKKSTRLFTENVNKRVDNVDNLFLNQVFSDIYNISGPHSYQQISWGTIFFQKVFDGLKGRQVQAFCAQRGDGRCQVGGRDAQSVCFPGGVDIRQNHPVRQRKRLGELGKQSFRSEKRTTGFYEDSFPRQ